MATINRGYPFSLTLSGHAGEAEIALHIAGFDTEFSATASTDGDGITTWTVDLSAEQTTALEAGDHAYEWCSCGSGMTLLSSGSVKVVDTVLSGDTVPAQSWAERMLEKVEATMADMADTATGSISVGDSGTIAYESRRELQRWRDRLARQVRLEQSASTYRVLDE